jgi:hypothetical protein
VDGNIGNFDSGAFPIINKFQRTISPSSGLVNKATLPGNGARK